jgi:hypothetical protein
MWELNAYLYDSVTSQNPEFKMYDRCKNIRLNWELHGGLRTIELDWHAHPYLAYRFYKEAPGKILVIGDNILDRPVGMAYITGVSLNSQGCHVVANGHWFRHFDQMYAFDTTAQTSEVSTLTYSSESGDDTFTDSGQDFSSWATAAGNAAYEIEVINDDDSESYAFLGNVVSTTEIEVFTDYALEAAGWLGDDPTGKTPVSYNVILCYNERTTSEIVKEILTNEVPSVSSNQDNVDETNTPVGFWEPPLDEGGMYPGEIIEKLASLSDSSNNQWSYWVKAALFNHTHLGAPVPYFEAQVDDGTYDWAIKLWMLAPGSFTMERNIQELRNAVRAVYRNMEDDDNLALEPEEQYTSDSTSISDYWRREVILSAGDSCPDIAGQYVNLYISKFKDALLSKTITLTSPYILDSNGARWPLWQPIKDSKSYVRFTDFGISPDILNESWDRQRCTQALSMEYNSTSHSLRLVLDLEDDSLDAWLARIAAFH